MPNYNAITKQEYDKIRILMDLGQMKINDIAIKTGRSAYTIRRIRNTKTYDEYVELTKEISEKHQKEQQKAEDRQVNVDQKLFEQSLLGMIREQNKMIMEQNEKLQLISNKLQGLIDKLS